jgi:subtilisin family serine protease
MIIDIPKKLDTSSKLKKIPKNYIMEFSPLVQEKDIDKKVKELENKYNQKFKHTFKSGLKGASGVLEQEIISELLDDPDILYIEKDHQGVAAIVNKKSITEVTTQGTAWQHVMTNTAGTNDDFSLIHCYVFDTGIKPDHQEFITGQVTLDYNAITKKTGTSRDDNGHGTAVAALIGGQSVGGAAKTKLHAIKVLDDAGSGYYSDIIAAIDWVITNRNKNFPTVINLSLGGPFSTILNNAIQKCIDNNISVIVAAGNSGALASNYSPSSCVNALTVAAHDSNKNRPSWSNYGSLVDYFAPGANVRTAWISTNSEYVLVDGTSFAAPVSVAIIIRFLKAQPLAKPADITRYLSNANIKNEIINAGTDSPNIRSYWDANKVILTPCISK